MFLHRYFAALYLPEVTGSLSTQRRERVKKKWIQACSSLREVVTLTLTNT